MRVVKLICGLIAVLAFTALATSSAFAAETLWTWLPGKENAKFTASSKKATLESVSKAKITCNSSLVLTGEGLLVTAEKTLGEATIHFVGCKTLGLPVNSVGDEKEIILVTVLLHNCLIAAGDGGILFKLDTPLHLNVPTAALLIVVSGSFIALVLEPNTDKTEWQLNIKQTLGVQEVEKCAGGKKDTLTASTDEKPAEEAGEAIEGEASIVFAELQEAMV